MSGSSGYDLSDNQSPAPAPGAVTADACLGIFRTKNLVSPNPVALTVLRAGVELTVSSTGSSLEIFTDQGLRCGSIISDVADVIECIKKGYEYIALVLFVAAGKCTVQLRLKAVA